MAEEIKKEEAVAANTKASEKKLAKKPAKKRFFSRVGNFFREYKSELKKVVWYPKDQVIHDTGVVVAALAAAGVMIGILDLAFTKIILLLGHIG